jgi:hypothetical protein
MGQITISDCYWMIDRENVSNCIYNVKIICGKILKEIQEELEWFVEVGAFSEFD